MNQNRWTEDEQGTWLRIRETVGTIISHVLYPKGDACIECGFLALGDGEMITHSRALLRLGMAPFLTKAAAATAPQNDGFVMIRDLQPNCFKSLWVRDPTIPYGISMEVNKRRRPCKGFFPYKPGYSPLEHRTLQEKKHERRYKIIIGVLGALATGLLGVVLALLKGWLNNYVGVLK
jgi:hypothetical protein